MSFSGYATIMCQKPTVSFTMAMIRFLASLILACSPWIFTWTLTSSIVSETEVVVTSDGSSSVVGPDFSCWMSIWVSVSVLMSRTILPLRPTTCLTHFFGISNKMTQFCVAYIKTRSWWEDIVLFSYLTRTTHTNELYYVPRNLRVHAFHWWPLELSFGDPWEWFHLAFG